MRLCRGSIVWVAIALCCRSSPTAGPDPERWQSPARGSQNGGHARNAEAARGGVVDSKGQPVAKAKVAPCAAARWVSSPTMLLPLGAPFRLCPARRPRLAAQPAVDRLAAGFATGGSGLQAA